MRFPNVAFASSLFPGAARIHRAVSHVHQFAAPQRTCKATVLSVSASAAPRRMPAIIRPVVPKAALLDFVEDKAQSRSTILKHLSNYVKENKLQDPNNKRVVLCDEKLKALFGVDHCTILEMSKYITPHLQKPEQVGGRYLEEAKLYEEQYLREKDIKDEEAVASGQVPASKRTKRRRRVSSPEAKNRSSAHLFRPVILSDELSSLCRNKKEMPRQQIVKAVWDYIRLNDLKGAPGEPVRCDFLLQKVFGAEQITVKTIMQGIEAHVTKKE